MITYSVKETKQQKEHWIWGLDAKKRGGEEVGKNLKKEGREYRCGLKKNRGPLIMVYTHMQ